MVIKNKIPHQALNLHPKELILQRIQNTFTKVQKISSNYHQIFKFQTKTKRLKQNLQN